jgi:hypothetical protein
MEQMNVPEQMKVKVDYTHTDLPPSVRAFRPLLFRDGKLFCCILGPDIKKGVFGCGDTPDDAFLDWDKNYQLRVKSTNDNDEVAQYLKDVMKTSVKKVW